ncbi:outer membrane beta-barrel protein [Bradyrhizobium sp. LjRoot220]|uniref:outer membrane protein n=1 Tax=Bradyrhizobium sp. LjRoot220 TaxID=3342284 RepID=UPI003ECF42AB
MNKFALGMLAVVAMTGTASAADLAARPYTKAPPPPIAAVYDWTGFYIGANAGGGWSHKCWDIVDPIGGALIGPEGCHDASGAVAGGQIGYRWQAATWVFGLEAQGNWADLTGSRVSQQFILVPGDAVSHSNVRAFGLFTGQIGYAWNNALLYVKGGAAVTEDRYEHRFTGTNVIFDSAKETRWGGVVGVGLEYGFAPNWSVGVEYDHLFMGDRTLTFTTPAGVPAVFDTRISQDVDIVTARINYRFGGPVVARY